MRVVLVTESFLPSVNGVTNSVLRILDTFRSRGVEARVIAPTAPVGGGASYEAITCKSVDIAGFPVGIPNAAVSQAIDDFRPDLVHVAAPFWLGGFALSHAAKRGIPSVAVYQTDVAGYMARYGVDFAAPLIDALTALIHRLATLNLAPTPDGLSYLHRLGVSNVALWGRGVDTQLFHPARSRSNEVAELRGRLAPQGEKLVGYVGRLAPEKQVERMLELCDLPHTRVVVVGDGPSRAKLEDCLRGAPVTFTGRLDGEDLARAYAAMDVFVHCGTEETFGQTIQEAHASGLPVVAPRTGGQRHLIRDGVDGFLVDHNRWGSFREKVALLLSDDLLRARVSHAAVQAVSGKTWEANNAVLLDYYDQVLRSATARVRVAA